MKKFPQSLAILVIASLALGCDQEKAKQSASAERAAIENGRAILAEIKELGEHEWAGTYYYDDDGLGTNTSVADSNMPVVRGSLSLLIAPKAGYVFECYRCLGLCDRNYGAVTSADGRIRLAFNFENKKEDFQGIAPELVPISWGSRHYLIPADDIIGFCNSVNVGREPRYGRLGSYFLRRGDEKKKVTGFPKVPQMYQEYLLAKPVEAIIVAVGKYTTRPGVGDWSFKDTPVTIGAGAREGLRVGMELLVTTPPDTVDESVRIKAVEESRSEGVMTQIAEDEPGPEVGWRLSTKAPWNAEVAELSQLIDN